MKRTQWSKDELKDFIEWHGSVVEQYPDVNVVYEGKTYNVHKELTQLRQSFVSKVPVK